MRATLIIYAALLTLSVNVFAQGKGGAPSEQTKMVIQISRMDFWRQCVEVGKVLRKPDISERGALWERIVLDKAGIPTQDVGYIRDRRLRLGMDECSVVAIMGKPSALNRSNHAGGRSDQLVYRSRGVYVYTENGLVRSWSE